MFLKRIQVPEFRALKNIDISFEQEFSPCIFPLGSLNGGGKSTLLQLIFILLTCAGDPDKHIFIQNMLEGFQVEETATKKLLVTIYLSDNNQDIILHFFCHTNEIIINQINKNEDIKQHQHEQVKFSSLSPIKEVIFEEILSLEDTISNLHSILSIIKKMLVIKKEEDLRQILQDLMRAIEEDKTLIDNFRNKFTEIIKDRDKVNLSHYQLRRLESLTNKTIIKKQKQLDKLLTKKESIELESEKILCELQKDNTAYVCNYIVNKHEKQEFAILCQIKSQEIIEVETLFKQISKKLFLAAPLTQVFLFLEKDTTKLLFRGNSQDKMNYYQTIEDTKKKLPNLFTYDILAVDLIIELIKSARDKDFKQAIESGEYGSTYISTLKELNSLLSNKKINIDSDLFGVNFKIEQDNETKELYPEDLSHGELKRLSIYVWLKYNNIEDSIVLMDEIENAFHPDWQYQIISDLENWGATNQYILATHSYELCQALTPSHVKEIEPNLLLKENLEN